MHCIFGGINENHVLITKGTVVHGELTEQPFDFDFCWQQHDLALKTITRTCHKPFRNRSSVSHKIMYPFSQ